MTSTQPTDRGPSPLRAEALEQLLIERGLIDPYVMDALITEYETSIGPLNGAKVAARGVDRSGVPAAAVRRCHRCHSRTRFLIQGPGKVVT
jgi:hypothetical protein